MVKPKRWIERIRLIHKSGDGFPGYENSPAYHQKMILEYGFETYLRNGLWRIGDGIHYNDRGVVVKYERVPLSGSADRS